MEQGFVPQSLGCLTLLHLGLPIPLWNGHNMDDYFCFLEEETPVPEVPMTSSRSHKLIRTRTKTQACWVLVRKPPLCILWSHQDAISCFWGVVSHVRHGVALEHGDITLFLRRWSWSARLLSSKAQSDDSEMKLCLEGKAESEETRLELGQPRLRNPRVENHETGGRTD